MKVNKKLNTDSSYEVMANRRLKSVLNANTGEAADNQIELPVIYTGRMNSGYYFPHR